MTAVLFDVITAGSLVFDCFVPGEEKSAFEILSRLHEVQRFDMVLMFLSPKDKNGEAVSLPPFALPLPLPLPLLFTLPLPSPVASPPP